MIREIVLTPEQGTVVRMVQKMFPNRYEQLLALPPDALEAKLFEELRGRKVDVYAARVDFNPETGRWRFNDGWFISYDRNDETRFEASRGTSIMHDEIPFSSIEFTDIPETPDDILNSIKEKDELPTWVIWIWYGARLTCRPGPFDLHDGLLLPARLPVGLFPRGFSRHSAGHQE